MNPLPIFILLTMSQGGKNPNQIKSLTRKINLPSLPTFDTFHMELMLDELHRTVNVLERVNRMSQLTREPITRERAPEILEALGAPDMSSLMQNFAPMLQNVAPMLQNFAPMLQNYAPLLQMLNTSSDNESE